MRGSAFSIRGSVGKVDYDLVTKVEREHGYAGSTVIQKKDEAVYEKVAPKPYTYAGAGAGAAANPNPNPVQCHFCNGFGHMKNKCHKFLAMTVANTFDKGGLGKGGKPSPVQAGFQPQLAIGNGGKGDKNKNKGEKGKGKKGGKA